jgi:protein disulfide-isomerase A1
MRAKSVLALATLLIGLSALEFSDLQTKDGIGQLTDANFKEFIGSHKYVLVLFYSMNCGISTKAVEYYTKIADKLSSENLKMPVTSIDVDQNPATATEQGIKGVPILRLYVKTYPIPFQSSSITPNVVFEWIQTVLANKFSDELKSLDDVKEIEELDLAVIMYLPRGDIDQLEDFNHVAGSHETIPFYYTHNEKHAKHLSVDSSHAFIILRRFDDGNKIFGGDQPIEMTMMDDFLKMFSSPLIEDLSQKAISRYSDNMGIALIYFGHGNKTESFEEIKKVCFHRHTAVGCIFADKDLHETIKFMEELGADESESQSAFLVHFRQKPELYKFNGEFTFDSLDQFIVGFFQKSIPRFYKTQLKKPDSKEMIPMVTGADFDDMITKSPFTIVLWVRGDNCPSCGQWKPILQDMQLSYSSQGQFIVYQIFGDKNEHPYLIHESIPAVLVYLKRDKTHPVEYKGNKEADEFKGWLSKTLKIKLKDLKEQSEDKKRRQEAGTGGQSTDEDTFEEQQEEELILDAVDTEDDQNVFDEGTEL